ncbi:MAG TPA: hypothetical protein VK812_05870, partial [Candidatus Binatus sp.]|nr:hypothetical protein [Candidatus Binatus sp.]
RLPTLILIIVILSVFVVRYTLGKRAQQKREASYQSVLRLYSEALRPGMTRLEVEEYLQTRNFEVRQMCCVDVKHFSEGVYDELTKIGEEDPPWFCSQKNVYIAFQFTGVRRGANGWDALGSDTLKSISIYRWLEGCL